MESLEQEKQRIESDLESAIEWLEIAEPDTKEEHDAITRVLELEHNLKQTKILLETGGHYEIL